MEGWGMWTLNDCKPELWSYQEVWREQDTGLRGKLNLLLRLIHCSNGMDTLDRTMRQTYSTSHLPRLRGVPVSLGKCDVE